MITRCERDQHHLRRNGWSTGYYTTLEKLHRDNVDSLRTWIKTTRPCIMLALLPHHDQAIGKTYHVKVQLLMDVARWMHDLDLNFVIYGPLGSKSWELPGRQPWQKLPGSRGSSFNVVLWISDHLMDHQVVSRKLS